jgi:hypothetical protein
MAPGMLREDGFPVLLGAEGDIAEHLAAGRDEPFPEKGKQFRGVGFFGEDGANECHTVWAEQGAAEVLQGSDEVPARRTGVDGGGSASWNVRRAAVAMLSSGIRQ